MLYVSASYFLNKNLLYIRSFMIINLVDFDRISSIRFMKVTIILIFGYDEIVMNVYRNHSGCLQNISLGCLVFSIEYEILLLLHSIDKS